MTTTHGQPLTLRTFATALTVRTAALLLAGLVFAVGWISYRQPASPLVGAPARQHGGALCGGPRRYPAAPLARRCRFAGSLSLTWKAEWRRTWLRAELADCFAAPDGLSTGATAERAVQHYEALLAQQAEAADAWLAEFNPQSSTHRARLQAELATLQAQPAGALTNWLPRPGRLAARRAHHRAREPGCQHGNRALRPNAARAKLQPAQG